MTRYRVTVRDASLELRGYCDGEDVLRTIADDMAPTLVIASEAPHDWNPFAISEPDRPPTPEASFALIVSLAEGTDAAGFMDRVATLHYHQATVIRGERHMREQAEAELRDRELHHFEVEQENAELRGRLEGATAHADALEANWESGGLAGAVTEAVFYLRELGKAVEAP